MITPQQKEILWVSDLECKKQHDGFQGIFTPIHIVPQKQIIRVRGEAPLLKDIDEIGKLAMDVPNNFDGWFQFKQHRLVQEYIFYWVDDPFDLIFWEFDFPASWFADQSLDEFLDVDGSYFFLHDVIVIIMQIDNNIGGWTAYHLMFIIDKYQIGYRESGCNVVKGMS